MELAAATAPWEAQCRQFFKERNHRELVSYRGVFSAYRQLLQEETAQAAELTVLRQDLRKIKDEFGDSPTAFVIELKGTLKKREEELLALTEQLKQKEAELAQSYRQNAAQAKSVFDLMQEKNNAVLEAEQNRRVIDMLAKENEVLKKTLDEKEKIVKVLMDERDELKAQRDGAEKRMLDIKKEMDDMRAEWELDRQAIERYQQESKKSTELINSLNGETQRLLNMISELKEGKMRRSSQGAPPLAEGQGMEDLKGSVIEGAKGVSKFFSGVFAKLNGEEEEPPIEVDEGLDEDEDVFNFGFSLLSADSDKIPKKMKRTFEAGSEAVNHIRAAFQFPSFATSGADGNVYIWDAMTSSRIKVLHGPEKSVMCTDFSPNNRFVSAASNDCCVYIWSYDTGRIHHKLVGHRNGVGAAYFSLDSRFVVSGSQDRCLKVWDIGKGTCVKTIMCGSRCNDLCFGGRGLICSAHFDKSVRVYDMRTGNQEYCAQVHNSSVTSVTLSPCSNYLLSNSRDNTLCLLDVRKSFSNIKTFRSESYRSGLDWNRACYSGGGKYAIAGSMNGKLVLWNVDTGAADGVLEPPTEDLAGTVACCCWNPVTASLLVAYKDSNTVAEWS